MKLTVFAATATVLVLAAAAPASAQFRPGDRDLRGPSLTLYEGPGFQGQSRTFGAGIANLADQGFNDRAQSVRVQGRWRLCEDSRLRGRCVEVTGDIPNLADLRLTVAISSFELLDGGFGGGRPPLPGGPGGGRPNPGPSLEGRTASFFPNPPQGPYRNANEFCRALGFQGAAYADDRGGFQLRDVLCRR